MTPLPLETLFLRYRDQHDLTALAQVFDRTAPQLLALARRLSGGLAEDLVQETFLAVIENSGAWDGRKPLVPWLLGILTHRAQRAWAKEGRTIDSERLTVREVEQPDEALAASELHAQVEHALKDLTPALQQAVRGSLYDGKSPTQLAVDLGLDSGTIRQRLFRGMSQLRLQLKGALLTLFALFGLRSQGLAAVRKQVLQEATRASVGGAVGLAAISLPARLATVILAASLCWVGAAALWTSEGHVTLGEKDSELVGLNPDIEVESHGATELISVAESQPRIVEAKPLEFAVQLVWDETGDPIPGREVSLRLKSGETTNRKSGANGQASFPYSKSDLPWMLGASSGPEGIGVSLFIGRDDPVGLRVVRLSKGGSLSGTVEDPEGNPVPNATVLGWSGQGTGDAPDRQTLADSDGRFTIEHLGKRFKLTATAPKLVCYLGLHGEVPAGQELEGHRIEMKPPADYVGRVLLPDGEPAIGVEVHFMDGSGGYGGWGQTHDASVEPFQAGTGVATTDSEGRFVMGDLPPGSRSVEVTHVPFLVYRDHNASNEKSNEIVLDAGGALHGTVRGSNGEPVADVQVAYWPHYKGIVTTSKWIVPDPVSGEYSITGIQHYDGYQQKPSHKNRGVVFRAPGFAVHMVTPIPDDLSELSPLNVLLDREMRIEGRVVDLNGTPKSGLRVRVQGDRTYESNMNDGFAHTWEKLIGKNITTTDTLGVFSFGELYPGEFEIRVYSGPGEQGSIVQHVTSGGAPLEFVLDDELLRGVVILPTVTDKLTGEPVKDFTLVQWAGGSGQFRTTTEGPKGPEVAGLDPGVWGIGINAEGYVSERLPEKHYKRGESQVNFKLCPTRSLEIRSLMPDGTEASGVSAHALDADGKRLMLKTSHGSQSSTAYLNSVVRHMHGLPARQVELLFYSGRFEASVLIDLSKPLPTPLVVHLRADGPEPIMAFVAAWELVPYEPKENVKSKSIIQPMAMHGLSPEESSTFFDGLGKAWFEEPMHPFSVSVDGPAGEGVFTMEYELLEADDPELVKWRKRQLLKDSERREGNPHDEELAQPRDLSGAQLRLTARSHDANGWSSTVSYPMVNRHGLDDEDTVFALEGSFPTIPGECHLHLTSEFYESIEFTWNPGQRQKGDPIPVLLLVPKTK